MPRSRLRLSCADLGVGEGAGLYRNGSLLPPLPSTMSVPSAANREMEKLTCRRIDRSLFGAATPARLAASKTSHRATDRFDDRMKRRTWSSKSRRPSGPVGSGCPERRSHPIRTKTLRNGPYLLPVGWWFHHRTSALGMAGTATMSSTSRGTGCVERLGPARGSTVRSHSSPSGESAA